MTLPQAGDVRDVPGSPAAVDGDGMLLPLRRRRWQVCPAGPPSRPQNVAKPGAVKHGRSANKIFSGEPGSLRTGSIGEFPRHEADMSTADAFSSSGTTCRTRPANTRIAKLPQISEY